MDIFEAIETIAFPIVIEEVYVQAEQMILKQIFTPNQRRLYAKLPVKHKAIMLKSLANRYLGLLLLL